MFFATENVLPNFKHFARFRWSKSLCRMPDLITISQQKSNKLQNFLSTNVSEKQTNINNLQAVACKCLI